MAYSRRPDPEGITKAVQSFSERSRVLGISQNPLDRHPADDSPGPLGINDIAALRHLSLIEKADSSNPLGKNALPGPVKATTVVDLYEAQFGKLNNSQRQGFQALLAFLDADPWIDDVRWKAYMLATVKHECANTWQPIEEYGKGKNYPYGVEVKVKGKGKDGKEHVNVYYGRGYVQLTWQKNYEKMSTALNMGDDLVIHPEKALEPKIAYRIMSEGMRKGSFTGKKLSDYINPDGCDYKDARKIINGLDQWKAIKNYAEKIEAILRQAPKPSSTPPPSPSGNGPTMYA